MNTEIFSDPILGRLGPIPLTRTMATCAATSALVIAFAWPLARAVGRDPGGRTAAAGRLVHRFLRSLVEGAAGRQAPGVEVFAGTLFLFVAGAAIVGQLPGVPAPTSNLGVTSALAALVFLAVPVAGVRALGPIGYFESYFRPSPLLFPFLVVNEVSRTLALTLRLFGNMLSGHLVVVLLVALVGPVVPVPMMALALLIGVLQAYIFAILACIYIGAGLRGGGEAGR